MFVNRFKKLISYSRNDDDKTLMVGKLGFRSDTKVSPRHISHR